MNVQAEGFMKNNPHFSVIDEGTGLAVDKKQNSNSESNLKKKKNIREEIDRDVELFIAGGGKIIEIDRAANADAGKSGWEKRMGNG